jgi:hypothetical protein
MRQLAHVLSDKAHSPISRLHIFAAVSRENCGDKSFRISRSRIPSKEMTGTLPPSLLIVTFFLPEFLR